MNEDQKPTTWPDVVKEIVDRIAFGIFVAFVVWVCIGMPGVKR